MEKVQEVLPSVQVVVGVACRAGGYKGHVHHSEVGGSVWYPWQQHFHHILRTRQGCSRGSAVAINSNLFLGDAKNSRGVLSLV